MTPVEIPPLSPTRARALVLVHARSTDAAELARVVEADPALTISVLRFANSAASASRVRITACRDAIVRIGFEATRQIVSGTVMGTTFDGLGYAGVDVDELWRHVLATALTAEAAAPPASAGDAFTAGLLHDVGRLAMASFDPDRYARVVDVARQGVDARRAEALLFGSDHCDWGVRVGWEWQLPAGLMTAAATHHEPPSGDAAALAVYTGRRIAGAIGIGDGISAARAAEIDTLSIADARVLASLGGPDGLADRIAVFGAAMGLLSAA